MTEKGNILRGGIFFKNLNTFLNESFLFFCSQTKSFSLFLR